MQNWQKLTNAEYKKVWNFIYEELDFKPSISYFPSFQVPNPFITYDISDFYGESVDLDVFDDLEEKALDAFKDSTLVDEYILALDWHHECYWINPRSEFEKDGFGEWTIPIFPNGDYYFFIQKDFKWGFLGHPWENSITIFGKELIDSFYEYKPTMFSKILRKS